MLRKTDIDLIEAGESRSDADILNRSGGQFLAVDADTIVCQSFDFDGAVWHGQVRAERFERAETGAIDDDDFVCFGREFGAYHPSIGMRCGGEIRFKAEDFRRFFTNRYSCLRPASEISVDLQVEVAREEVGWNQSVDLPRRNEKKRKPKSLQLHEDFTVWG